MPAGALSWDGLAERLFKTGVSNGVLYHQTDGVYNDGEAWNGLTTVTESPSGAEPNKQYADNIAYLNILSAEEFAATIECFTAPDGFDQYDGIAKTSSGLKIGMQARGVFGFSWKTKIGSALDEDLGYEIHFAYGLQASPSEKTNTTVNDSPEPQTYSWTLSSTPVAVTGRRPTAIASVSSVDPSVDPDKLAALELILYGTVGVAPRLPLPDEIDTILGSGILTVTPLSPTFNGVDDEITIPGTTGVVYKVGGTVVTGVVAIVADTLVTATPAAGYTFTGVFVTSWLFEV